MVYSAKSFNQLRILQIINFLGINIICECCECFKEIIMNAGYFVLAIKEENYGKKKEAN